jgi:2-C-methyl-D-erythritol 4-phosphate cytidylyltransferase
LRGRPLLQWSLDALKDAGCVRVVVVVPKDLHRVARDLLSDEAVEVVDGGQRRQDSVWNGLRHIDTPVVVVHDGARPLVTADLVRRGLEALDGVDGAVPVVEVNETLKQVKEDDVVKTVDRSKLRRVQTPQVFVTSVLKEAHTKARADKLEVTDDAQLVERYGGRVRIFEGDRTNIKVTYEEDLAVIEAILAAREAS